jgi:hypothetical protein
MKNIQIIDGANNCTYSIFQATEEEFALIFPGPGQDIEFIEDLLERIGAESDALVGLWDRPILKPEALGIHGTLFYEFEGKRAHFPATKREKNWNPLSINATQRRLYASVP